MDTKRKDGYNTEAEPLLDLYDTHVDMTAIDNTIKCVRHFTSPAAVVALSIINAHVNSSAPASSVIQAEYRQSRNLGNGITGVSAFAASSDLSYSFT
ncbi:hypothetical protein EC957_004174 [Mortierella hygrophila]|uniref:Uncharacterized protein n=1 Tax=Mortierella hygrophila TaxID=979708 RepID=A0A9P6FJ07_9FUNG|nr:hypothetical protein EC957_004174 [Mortierella hygrophila]